MKQQKTKTSSKFSSLLGISLLEWSDEQMSISNLFNEAEVSPTKIDFTPLADLTAQFGTEMSFPISRFTCQQFIFILSSIEGCWGRALAYLFAWSCHSHERRQTFSRLLCWRLHFVTDFQMSSVASVSPVDLRSGSFLGSAPLFQYPLVNPARDNQRDSGCYTVDWFSIAW